MKKIKVFLVVLVLVLGSSSLFAARKNLTKADKGYTTWYYVDGGKVYGYHGKIFFYRNGEKVYGVKNTITGDITNVWGDSTNVRGLMTGIYGDLTDIDGNVDTCELTAEERAAGVNISSLVI
jgi:hypothetical protein